MKIFPSYVSRGGPFSAVRPDHIAEPAPPEEEAAPGDEVVTSPIEGAEDPDPGRPRIPTEEMRREGSRSAVKALAAFPQVVHLLTASELPYGESLAAEVDLPLVSLGERSPEELSKVLRGPEYQQGFIIEGIPSSLEEVEKLENLLSATGQNERRVLSWEYSSQSHQDVLDHYIDQGLLWMVPPCTNPGDAKQVKEALKDCLVGLPALQ